MMQRLREQTSSTDVVTARAAALLSAMPPLDANRLRPRTPPGPVRRHVAGTWTRPGVVLAVTLGTVAATAATLKTWPFRGIHEGSSEGASAVSAALSERGSGPAAPATLKTQEQATRKTVEEVAVTGTAAISPPVPALPVSPPLPATPVRALRPLPRASAQTTSERDLAVVEDESTLIVRAVRALRRDGDPALAQDLAEQALLRFPRGAQVEEATALVMEAAAARGNAAAARRAAQTYLDRFPSGRFADRAQRILSSPGR
jgi:hypothetical protein